MRAAVVSKWRDIGVILAEAIRGDSILQVSNKTKDQPVLRVEHDCEVEVELVGAAVGALAFGDRDWAAEET